MAIKLKELMNEGKDAVYIQGDTLWWSYSPGSGLAVPLRGKTFFTNNSADKGHFDVIVEKIMKWAKTAKPLKQNRKRGSTLYKIPNYIKHERMTSDLSVWGGDVQPQKAAYLVIIKDTTGRTLVNIFNKKQEAEHWYGEGNG